MMNMGKPMMEIGKLMIEIGQFMMKFGLPEKKYVDFRISMVATMAPYELDRLWVSWQTSYLK